MSVRSFLQSRNIEFSLRRYGIDALNYMTLGLFGSLVIGLILKTVGGWTGQPWLIEAGTMAQQSMGAAIGVAVAYGLQAPPIVIFASAAIGALGAKLGGPVGCFFAVAVASEMGKLVSRTTPLDIIVTPATALVSGFLVAQWISPFIGNVLQVTGNTIQWAMSLQPFVMSIILAVVMGMILTGPTSSAALAISLNLGGLAGGAATVGCAAQMIGFATMSYRENGVSGLLSQGLGTSMLQLPNIVRNPRIWIPPILAAAILGPIATLGFGMQNVPTGSGMGTSGFVGQVGTLAAMGDSAQVWLSIGLLHFLLPAVLTLAFAAVLRRIGWIRPGDLKIDAKI
ncbi:PTS sugar transporter subunit IIC [Lampropedia aestuarii]|uniref:PTS sugar transporter subunit IIC n=1 Tax=Lampropedia aestuarii TaxID=2562762 RepID=A0A4S5BEJ6_9BURK|nr:PTS sugar transporter subunit IIC [Lampropedia aestuarii]MDH5856058.1 PTS sugar transporter subunit IIC [Lampropedia aestuarii]THJ30704.1 PTS sugar transporter subunit IIC [Lampropedia aestuarii]